MPTDLLILSRNRPPSIEDLWRDIYHNTTWPFTESDGQCVLANGLTICATMPTTEESQCRVDEICANLTARGTQPELASESIVVLIHGVEQSMAIEEVVADLDGLAEPEVRA